MRTGEGSQRQELLQEALQDVEYQEAVVGAGLQEQSQEVQDEVGRIHGRDGTFCDVA